MCNQQCHRTSECAYWKWQNHQLLQVCLLNVTPSPDLVNMHTRHHKTQMQVLCGYVHWTSHSTLSFNSRILGLPLPLNTCGSGTIFPSGVPETTPSWNVLQIVVCAFVLFLSTIVLSFFNLDYIFGIFKLLSICGKVVSRFIQHLVSIPIFVSVRLVQDSVLFQFLKCCCFIYILSIYQKICLNLQSRFSSDLNINYHEAE